MDDAAGHGTRRDGRPTAIELKWRIGPVDLREDARTGNFLEDHMNVKLNLLLVACVALLVSACGSSPQSMILGRWEAASAQVGDADAGPAVGSALNAIKMTAEFDKDGAAKLTMFGQTLQGTYKVIGENELEWTMSGITTKSKMNVTAIELDLTDDSNRTIKYKRK